MVCIYILFIHGHLGFFYLLTTMNSAAMNMGMYIFQDSVFNSFGYIPRSGNAGSLLIFEEHILFHNSCTTFSPKYTKVPVFHTPAKTLFFF